MSKGKYVFSQLLSFLDPFVFTRISKKYEGDKYIKHFSCWNQLAVLMFGQLFNRESLRDVVLATQAHASKVYHLGFGKAATKSNLSKANANWDYRIFEEYAYRAVAWAQECRATDIFRLGGKVYAFDLTTIELCLETFKWALYRKKQRKGGIKVHTLYDVETQIPTFFHITPAQVNDFKPVKWSRRFPKGSGIISDCIGYMDGQKTMEKYPDKIRRIIYWDEEEKRQFIFFTNALDLKPVTVALLYKNRWQIELFFKWMKQHLKIKKFWGESENAVRIQIYSAITAYCMMAIVQKKLQVKRSIYEMCQIASISLTDTTDLKTLFGKSNNNIVNERNGSEEPTLFDCLTFN